MKKYLGLLIVLIIALSAGINTVRAEDSAVSGGIKACTMEAKLCPDGSYVGRTGPNCEFSACPGSGEGGDVRKLPIQSGSRNDDALREAAKQKLENLREAIKSEKDAAKAKIKEDRINMRINALARFDAAVTRISNLEARVNTEIATLEAKGVDVSGAKTLVATADSNLNTARAKITEINSILSVSINELTAANKTQLVALAKDTQNIIKQAHQALRDAVKLLKDALKATMDEQTNAGND
jgi:hypothetical protein